MWLARDAGTRVAGVGRVSPLYLALAIMGALVLGLGLLSRPMERLPLSAPMLALLLGVLLGPQALDVLDPQRWGDARRLLEEGARLTLAIGLMAIALHLPPDYLAQQWRSLAVLLLVAMPLMALCAGLLTYAVLGMPLVLALLAGALVCPTDPIVAASIVTGKVAERSLPVRLRHLLLGESGANDGLASPLVWLAMLLLTRDAGEAWQHWILRTLLWEVGGALLAGALVGHAAGRLLTWAENRHTMELASFFAYALALTLFTLGAAELAGINGILAVFVSGLAFGRAVGSQERRDEERVQEAINGFFTLPIFVLIGLLIPWQAWKELGWAGAALVASILALRRLPAVLLLRRAMPDLASPRDAWFAGWFGPIGVAAVFYALLAARHTGHEELWHVTSLIVCGSVLIHGVTAAPMTLLYGRLSAAARGPAA